MYHPLDFNEFKKSACFEYRNTGEERIVLARLTMNSFENHILILIINLTLLELIFLKFKHQNIERNYNCS